MRALKDAWDHVYGSKSHMNLAGKLIIGIPLFPVVASMIVTWVVLDSLFTKTTK